MEYDRILNLIGEQATNISTLSIQKLAEYGMNISGLPAKILSIIIFLIILYFASRISQVVLRTLIMLASIVFIISIGWSIFYG